MSVWIIYKNTHRNPIQTLYNAKSPTVISVPILLTKLLNANIDMHWTANNFIDPNNRSFDVTETEYDYKNIVEEYNTFPQVLGRRKICKQRKVLFRMNTFGILMQMMSSQRWSLSDSVIPLYALSNISITDSI